MNERFPGDSNAVFRKFEAFHTWLVSENAKINLFSRRMDQADIWTVHFLDSLLPTPHVDFRGRDVLDFGTGGGLPGVPLAIVYGSAGTAVTLLDSTKKKIAAVRRAVEHLGLTNCRFIDRRVEEIGSDDKFDIIVSRSVKIEPAYKPTLLKLLKPRGKIVLYKGKTLDDVHQFDNAEIFDVGNDITGERKIVVVNT